MSILSTHNLSLSFGDFDLFQGISVTVPNDGKIGLIGPNGIGKTSLLLIMAGLNLPSTGSVQIARGRRIGYLRQEAVDAFAARDNTVYGEMLTVFTDLQKQQKHLHQLEALMAAGDHSHRLLEEYGELQLAFEHAGGYDYDLRIRRTLSGLGLDEQHWQMPLAHLSGGQKTRALLARLLLEKPDLLMLDEPTNHLDTEAIEWLEHALDEWEGAVLVASHDRFFLDNTVDTIWEMSRAGIEIYSGNYSAYLLQRDERWEYYQRVFKEEKARLAKEMDFVQRNWVRASTHARALGLLRRVSRDLAIVDSHGVMGLRNGKKWSEIELDKGQNAGVRLLDVTEAIRKVNAIQLPGRPPRLRPRFTPTHTSGNIILRAEGVTFGYPGNPLFTAEDVELRRGERVALLGPNGSGKTTFIKTLLKELPALQGRVHLGASLKIGYFAQAHDSLDPQDSVIEALIAHKGMREAEARSYLAQYLFQGDDVFKPVSALSGGERSRLALAILAVKGANFLLLDEPTNHLDIPAQEVLEDLLRDFPGTILMVSHDRYLVNQLATQIWELKAGELRVFRGNYRQLVLQRAELLANNRQVLFTPKPLARDNSRTTRKQQEALQRLEARIDAHEQVMRRLNKALEKAGGQQTYEQVYNLSEEYARAQAKMEDLMAEWEQLAV